MSEIVIPNNFPQYLQHAVEGPCHHGHLWMGARPEKLGYCPTCKRGGDEKESEEQKHARVQLELKRGMAS